MKNCVFIHIPRTGGSSVWHSLVGLGTESKRGICDIYHETKVAFGSPSGGAGIVESLRRRVGAMPVLFHHHTSEPILQSFAPEETVLATVLRDPVARFISEVLHSRSFLQSCDDPAFVDFHAKCWGRRYVRALTDPQISSQSLLDIAASVKFFNNYYTKYFSALLDFRCPDKRMRFPSQEFLRNLAHAICSRFSIVGDFNNLNSTYAEIAEAFGIGGGQERLRVTVNRATSAGPLDHPNRRRYLQLFASDYSLIQCIRDITIFSRSQPRREIAQRRAA